MTRGSKLVEIFNYRGLLYNLTVNELKLRYRRSVLGFLWTLLNPLLMMTVLTLVFSRVMRFNTKDYSVLLLAALLPWTFFSQAINLSLMSIVGKGALLKKVYIPKAIIPISAVLATLVNSSLAFVPLLSLTVVVGHKLTSAILFLPIAMAILAIFTIGWALLFSCLYVYFRDFGHMTEVLLQAWFYASPVIYTLDMVPEQYRGAFTWNPVTYFIECFRAPIFSGELPSAHTVGVAVGAALASMLVGTAIFLRYENQFVLKV
jgi:ABC-type polysaccharide/polyol phosphate export permease